MKHALGKQEAQFLAYVQLRELRTVRTGDMVRALRLTAEQERELFRRLARGGIVARVRPGLYLVPPRLPLGGSWSPNEILALNTLVEDRQGRYQITGPNSFSRYGLDEQIPTRIYAYNNRISGERRIGSVQLTLIKVDDARLGATEEVRNKEGFVASYGTLTRTLVDAVYDWARFNTLPRAYAWILGELDRKRVTPAEVVEMTLRYGDLGTVRRIGVLLEQRRADERLLRRLEKRLPSSTGLIPWIPTLPKRGRIDRRWGVVVNGEA